MEKGIPVTSLQRLPVYLNFLKSEKEAGFVSSGYIAKALGMGEVLVRKDLAYTPAQGRTRVGYKREELIAALEEYLGCNEKKTAVIMGAGALGRALLSYGGFVNYGIEVAGAFDTDSDKLGKICGKPVWPLTEARQRIKLLGAMLGIICVPSSAAQSASDMLIEGGVSAIMNFAPVILKVPQGVNVRNIDLAANLAVLTGMR